MRTDDEFVHQVVSEFNKQKTRKTINAIQLPCGHRVQILKPEDQYLSHCGKSFLYIHSRVNKKLYQ